MNALQIFVISWRGQHERAQRIAQTVSGCADKVAIIYSDPDAELLASPDYVLIRRDDRLFWADKFQACLQHCASDDIMLVIHADCDCDDWERAVHRCRKAFSDIENIGVWAPKLTGTPWPLTRTRIRRMPDSCYSIVAQTDGLVFALNPALLPRMKEADYSQNVFGLGIDWMFLSAAYAQNMIAVVDEDLLVEHQVNRGYSSKEARAQKREFLDQLTARETAVYKRLRLRTRALKIINKNVAVLRLYTIISGVFSDGNRFRHSGVQKQSRRAA